MPFLSSSIDFSDRPLVRLGVQISSFDRDPRSSAATYKNCSVNALIDTGAEHSQVDLAVL